jgi:nicotinamide-nucleotide adenylyltransferase
MSKKSALYIGRFQPFHKGHLDALHQIFENEEQVIIVIGSAEDDFVPENPFTAGERYQMIQCALAEAGIDSSRYSIIPIRNIKHYSLWVRHLETLLPPFSIVYTGSSVVTTLFKTASGYGIRSLQKNVDISSTIIREMMRMGDNGWREVVPACVVELIDSFDGEKRLIETADDHNKLLK